MSRIVLKNNYIQYEELDELNVIGLFSMLPYNFNIKKLGMANFDKSIDLIQQSLNYKFKKVVVPEQKHTDKVVCVKEDNINDSFSETDGLITNLSGVALCNTVADCESIMLFDPVKRVIGNIHSGWRGTVKKIIKNAIEIMISEYGCIASDIKVIINPSILKCCFEVEEDVKKMFCDSFDNIDDCIEEKNDKYFIDCAEINKRLIKSLGVLEDNIFVNEMCTFCQSDILHSFRADGEYSGRNLSLICIRDEGI